MIDGVYFFWVGWMGWIIATFLASKQNPIRVKMAVAILAAISISRFSFNISGFQFTFIWTMLLIGGYCYVAKHQFFKQFYYLAAVLVVTLIGAGVQLVILYDPALIWFPVQVAVGAALFIGTQLVISSFADRLAVLIIGVCQAEVLLSFIMITYGITTKVGSFRFLDTLAISLLLLGGWKVITISIEALDRLVRPSATTPVHLPIRPIVRKGVKR